ncbi:MAG: hypothetical protein PVG74_25545 [Desulfobacterales bacterium]
MFSSSTRNENNSVVQSFPAGYNSAILKEFVETLERLEGSQTLDLGPVCQENMMFFAHRMGRHYVCDMFLRLKGEKNKQSNPSNGWKYLDYPEQNFDGIQLWDICDHLEDDEVSRLADSSYKMLKATGLLMMIAYEKKPTSSIGNAFVIGQDFRVDVRPQPHLDLSWKFRHNRALTSLLSNFTIVRSFRYHSGIREFLFKKPGGPRG